MWNFIFSAAGNAFSQAASLHLQMQSKHDAATNFIDAGNAFKKADPQGKNLSLSTFRIWLSLKKTKQTKKNFYIVSAHLQFRYEVYNAVIGF